MRLPHVRTASGRAALVLVVVAATAAFAACTLNPQPLPPGDDSEGQATGDFDASTRADAGGFTGTEPPAPASDAGQSANGDGGPNADDGGDGGDAGGGDAGDGDAGDGG